MFKPGSLWQAEEVDMTPDPADPYIGIRRLLEARADGRYSAPFIAGEWARIATPEIVAALLAERDALKAREGS